MIQKRHRDEARRKIERRRTLEILGLEPDSALSHSSLYDPSFHPQDIVAYFQETLSEVEKIERVVNRLGDVKYVQAPVSPPTFAGYAAKIGVSTECLWSWGLKYQEFEIARDRARAIQQDVIVRMAALGAWVPSVSIFMLKNLHGWTDRAEVEHKATVSLTFDSQDEDA